jgi:hypothetical protein
MSSASTAISRLIVAMVFVTSAARIISVSGRLVQPGERLAGHLVPVELVEQFVAGLGMEADWEFNLESQTKPD